MPIVRIPALLQALSGGASEVRASGATLRDVIDDLERQFPGMGDRLVDAGALRRDVMIAVGGDEVSDLNAPVPEDGEVLILPAISGGSER
jgi:molybdopterin converting factor small subunit